MLDLKDRHRACSLIGRGPRRGPEIIKRCLRFLQVERREPWGRSPYLYISLIFYLLVDIPEGFRESIAVNETTRIML